MTGNKRRDLAISGILLLLSVNNTFITQLANGKAADWHPPQVQAVWTTVWQAVDSTHPLGLALGPEESVYMVLTTYRRSDIPLKVHVIQYGRNGSVLWKISPSFAKAWFPSLSPHAIMSDSDGTLFLAGAAGNWSAADALLVRIETNASISWEKYWGGEGSERFIAVTVDSDNNVIAVGETSSFGSGDRNGLVVKFSPWGEQLWNFTWTELNPQYDTKFHSLAVGANGAIYIVGMRSREILTAKLDHSGQLQWNFTWGRTYQIKHVIGCMPRAQGGVVVLGWGTGDSTTDNSEANYFSLVLNEDGYLIDTQLWNDSYPLENGQLETELSDITEFGANEFLVIGSVTTRISTEESLSFESSTFLVWLNQVGGYIGNTTWSEALGFVGDMIVPGSGNYYYISGYLGDSYHPSPDRFIAQIKIIESTRDRRSGIPFFQATLIIGSSFFLLRCSAGLGKKKRNAYLCILI